MRISIFGPVQGWVKSIFCQKTENYNCTLALAYYYKKLTDYSIFINKNLICIAEIKRKTLAKESSL